MHSFHGCSQGGKIDDITVLVAVVVEEEVPAPVVEQTPDDSEAESEAAPSQESL